MPFEPVLNAKMEDVLQKVAELQEKHPLDTYVLGKPCQPWAGDHTPETLALEGYIGVYKGPRKPVPPETLKEYNRKVKAYNDILGVESTAPMLE